MIKIDVIIANYNTKDLLKKCVDNLLEINLAPYAQLKIIIVDNGSTDQSAQMIKKEYSQEKITLIEEINRGLAHGYNVGYEKSDGDYILYLGTDSFPTKDQIVNITEFMEQPENNNVGICTPKLILRDGSLDMDAHRGLSTPWSSLTHWFFLDRIFSKSAVFNQYYLGYKDFNVPHEIDVCISHFMFVRKKAHDEVGKWDERYFLFGEDLDFCYRIQQAGYKIIYLSNVSVIHYKGAGVGRKSTKDLDNASRRDKTHLKNINNESVKAMKIFYQTHLDKKYPWILNKIVYFGIFCMSLLRSVLSHVK